jgi:polysaccharide export outer membrane protein
MIRQFLLIKIFFLLLFLAFTPKLQAQVTLTTPTYTLRPGDRLKLDVLDVPEYSSEYQVGIDGTLNLPVIGIVDVEGLTIEKLDNIITSLYARYVVEPEITVNMIAYRPFTIAIVGEVVRPGSYTLEPSNNPNALIQLPTVSDIIQLAGGITRSANVRQVKLRRYNQGTQQFFDLNLWDLFASGDLSQNLLLQDGDSLFIPTTEEINPEEIRQLAASSLAVDLNQPLRVTVVGEVLRPGTHLLGEQAAIINRTIALPTLTQALEQAGGITILADIRRVTLRRQTRSGREQILKVNLWELLQNGDPQSDLILQEGDTISVAQATTTDPSEIPTIRRASFSPDKVRVTIAGEVQNPGTIEVLPETPLNQVLLSTGGFDNRRANTVSVDLIRLNPNGSVSKQTIELDFAKGINPESNPTLSDGDAIIVYRSAVTSFSDSFSEFLRPLGSLLPFTVFFR